MKKILIVTLMLFSIVDINAQNKEADFNNAVNSFNNGLKAAARGDCIAAETMFTNASLLFTACDYKNNALKADYQKYSNYVNCGKIDDAATGLKSVLESSLKIQPCDSQTVSACYKSLGAISAMQAKVDESLNFYNSALNIDTRTYGTESPEVAQSYSGMAAAYSQKDDFSNAELYFKKAKTIMMSNTRATQMLPAVCKNLGVLYCSSGRYDDARAEFDYASGLIDSSVDKDWSVAADIYSGYAEMSLQKNELDAAETYINKAIEIKKQLYGEKNIRLSEDYNRLALIYKQRSDLENALTYFKLSGNIIAATYGIKHPDLGGIYNNIVGLYILNDDPEGVEEYYSKALASYSECFGPDNPFSGFIYNNMGKLYMSKSDYQSAENEFNRAIAILSKYYGVLDYKLIDPYVNMASVCMEKKLYEQAVKYYNSALQCNLKDFSTADDIYSVPHFGSFVNGVKLIETLKNRNRALLALYLQKNYSSAAQCVVKSVYACDSLINNVRRQILSETDKLQVSEYSFEIYETALSAAYALYINDKQENIVYDAFNIIENSKSALLREAVASAAAARFAGIPESELLEEQKVSQTIYCLKQQIAESDQENRVALLKLQLIENEKLHKQIIAKFETEYPAYYNSKYSNPLFSVSNLQNFLNSDCALINYFFGSKDLYYVCIEKNRINFYCKPAGINFERNIKNWHNAVVNNNPESFAEYRNLSYEIYKTVFPESLSDNIDNLIIIPDGFLGVIPFEALLTSQVSDYNFKNYPYLINKYTISYNYSAQQAIYNASTFSKGTDWTGTAPVFDSHNPMVFQGIKLSPIPESLTEIESLVKLLNNKGIKTDELTLSQATESAFKSLDFSKLKYIHIATHGTVNSQKPELSGLFFSIAPSSDDDGMLYSGEIYNLKLDADLVILSACETGLGQIVKGEGVIGLQRALLYAGARNIVVSFWQVSDVSTSKLMIKFYDCFLKTDTQVYAKSLREAKLDLINNTQYNHPYYWSSFVLIGI